MDLFLISIFSIGLLFIPLYLIFFYKGKPTNHSLPPGKTGWPVVGEALDMVSCGRTGQPEKFVQERMKKHSPEIFKTSLAGETMAVFCGPSGNKFLFSNENKLVVSWWPPAIEKISISTNSSSIVMTKKMRNIIPEFTKPEALQKYVPIMDFTARKQVEKEWSNTPNGEVKVFPLSKSLTFSLACKLFMSIDDPQLIAKISNNFELVTAGILSVPIDFPGTAFNRAIKAANMIRKELSPVIKQRRNDLSNKKEVVSTHDLLSRIILSTGGDGKILNDMEIVDMILGILVASHDTTSTVITFMVYYLADHPHIYAKVMEGK